MKYHTHIRKTREVLLGSVSAAAYFLVGAPAVAQTDSDDAAGGDDDVIVVTATRREENIIDTPVSTSVINTDERISNGITDINALADFVPGLTATDGGGPGLGNLVIRNLYVGGSPTVGTYIDDVPYGAVVGGFAANLALDASLYDLERVEVVRGPQGTLFGASAVGGVVRYVTRDPDLQDFEGYAFGDVSTTKDGGVNFLTKGRASIPVVKDRLAISVSGFYDAPDGYVDNALTGDEDINSHDYWGGRVAAKAVLTDRITFVASATHHEADYDATGYEDFDPTTGDPIFGELLTSFTAPRTLNFDLYSLTGDIDLDFATLTTVTSFQNVQLVNLSDVTAALGGTADFLAPGGAPHTVALSSGDDSDRFTQELRLTSNGENAIDWIIGAYYTKQESDSFQITQEMPADIDLIDLNSRQEYTEYAIFGNLTYNITDNWDVTGGVRVSFNENIVTQDFTGVLSNPLLNDLVTENDDTVATWLFNTHYSVNDAVNLYARVASGYRPGGSNLVVDIGGTVLGEPTYTSDSLISYEAGIKGELADGALYYDVGGYYITWDDTQIAVTFASGLGGTGNAADKIKAKGLEASLTGELFENFFVNGTLAISDNEFKADEPALGAVAGEEIPGTTGVSASLAADYLYPVSSNVDFNIGATFRHTGSYNSNFAAAPTGNFENDAYSQFDLRAGLRTGHVSVNAYVTNVGNSSAYQTVFAQAPTFAFGVPLRPRTIGGNVRVDF